MLTLNTEITKINRVGTATAQKLKRLGIITIEDLLYYFPFRYDDFTHITKIERLQAGISANIVGRIELIQNKRSPRRRMYITEALINDETETLKVIWFNQPFIARNLKVGDSVSLAGKVSDDYGALAMVSPVYEKFNPPSHFYKGGSMMHTQGLVPNYHLTANLTQKHLRFLIKQIMPVARQLSDWLPFEVRKNIKLQSLFEAVNKIHFPKTKFDIEEARKRLAFNELFLLQIRVELIRRETWQSVTMPIKFYEKQTKRFVDSLAFRLTDEQRKAAWEIIRDIGKNRPMARLLEGDVGSGKTIVALLAMYNVALNKKQAVLMVPTEILARQHFDTVSKLLSGFRIKVGLVTRSQKMLNNELRIMNNGENAKSKNYNLLFIIHNSDIIIGTHALIQEDVSFKNLALVVIDEQHRFGVEQRKTLTEKSGGNLPPHLLSMTATPIPRSLALAIYGDLDLSVINEMPKGRKNIITRVVPENKREQVYQFIKSEIKKGRQVFVICPLIDPSDKLGVKSVKIEYEKLDKEVFPEIKIASLHGRMKSREKEKVMQDFLDRKTKILVSTSVVEVGVDVPNATIMLIEGADRFGLAQLHQFRGRVGRSDEQSYCFLFSESETDRTIKRLEALTTHHSGFELARIDLKFRGPGEIYGLEQKGFPELKIASLFDYQLMKLAQTEAEKLISKDPTLNTWPGLKNKLGQWEKAVHRE